MSSTTPLPPPVTKQGKNEETVTKYFIFLCSLTLVVVTTRWLQYRRARGRPSSSSSKRIQSCLRRARLLAFHKLKLRAAWEWLGRPSTDFAVLVSVFLVANAILCSTSFASPAMNHVASRYGWIGAVNMTLCVFFGMKNTPLSFLSRVSHAEINILHRIVGYLACLLILGHAVLYTIHFGRKGDWHRFIEQADLAGIGAGIAMLVLLVMGLVRHRCYESFYFSHIASFAVTVFLVILHRPSWVKKLPYLMLFTLFIWLVDRTIRAATLTRNLLNNQATCYPLPGGGVRLLLNKSSAHVVPGSHCYLWIPRVRLYQMHPFTVVSNGPSGLELVIKAKSGYTKGLHDYATTHPGRPMHASIDGPYGSVPDTAKYDKLVLIAGGSGAAYTVGLLNRVMHSSGRMASQSIDFIWAVRSKEHLSWFGEHLRELASDPAVNVVLYITGQDTCSASNSVGSPTFSDPVISKDVPEMSEFVPLLDKSHKKPAASAALSSRRIEYSKLDVEAVVRKALLGSGGHQSVLIATCGPKSLTNAIRESVDDCKDETSHNIDMHCEDFGV